MSDDLIMTRPRTSVQVVSERGGGKDERKSIDDYAHDLFRYRIITLAWLMFVAPALAGRYIVPPLLAAALWFALVTVPKQRDGLTRRQIRVRIGVIVAAGFGTLWLVDTGALEHVWYPVYWGWRNGTMPLTIGRAPVIVGRGALVSAWVLTCFATGLLVIGKLKLWERAPAALVITGAATWLGWATGVEPHLSGDVLVIEPVVVRLSQWFVFVRAFLLIGPPLAWDRSFRFAAWRKTLEMVAPTASSPPVAAVRASSVQPPRGAPIASYLDADKDPGDNGHQPQRTTVIRDIPNGHPVRVLSQSTNGDPNVIHGGGSGRKHEYVPTELFAGRTDAEKLAAQERFAAAVLRDPAQNYSRNKMKSHFASDTAAREFFEWMKDKHYARQTSKTAQELTPPGAYILECLRNGEREPDRA
jgi:hypothetical protein